MNPEDRYIEDGENACPCCSGSGHKDDARIPLARLIAEARDDGLLEASAATSGLIAEAVAKERERILVARPDFGASTPEPDLKAVLVSYYLQEFDLARSEAFADQWIAAAIRQTEGEGT